MRVCVYCSSSDAVDPVFGEVAERIGRLLGEGGHGLVYGGTAVGMMRRLATAVRDAGGHVVGVLPRLMVERGLADDAVDQQVVTDGMRARKQAMEDAADAFVVLPGGFGTLEELFEVLTLKQLGYHDKAIVLVDVVHDGRRFWRPLLELFGELYEQGFARREYAALYHVADGPDDVLPFLETYEPPPVPAKWV